MVYRNLEPVAGPQDIYFALERARRLPYSYKILAYVLYLSAARVSEALTMRAADVRRVIEKIDGQDCEVMIMSRRGSKNRAKPRIEIPVIAHADEYETRMLREVQTYAKDMDDEDMLFPFMNRKKFGVYLKRKARVQTHYRLKDGTQVFGDAGINPHFLRKCRLTHLASIYGFTEYKIMYMAGWATPIPARTYVKMNWRNYIPLRSDFVSRRV